MHKAILKWPLSVVITLLACLLGCPTPDLADPSPVTPQKDAGTSIKETVPPILDAGVVAIVDSGSPVIPPEVHDA